MVIIGIPVLTLVLHYVMFVVNCCLGLHPEDYLVKVGYRVNISKVFTSKYSSPLNFLCLYLLEQLISKLQLSAHAKTVRVLAVVAVACVFLV
jgi:hypothetical protein